MYLVSFETVFHNWCWCNKCHGMYYPVCGIVHKKISDAANKKRVAHEVTVAGFLFHYLSAPLIYIQCHITVIKYVECIVK